MSAKLRVLHAGRLVGHLAMNARGELAFQYDGTWLNNGFDLAPHSLPFDDRPNLAPSSVFAGLHGVLNDSLPDGWGLLIMDRALKQHKNLAPQAITPLDRLAYIGHRGMGALEYQPALLPDEADVDISLAQIAEQSEQLLKGDAAVVLEALRICGGSPGGARPKVTVAFSPDGKTCISGFHDIPDGYSHWIVKFRNDSHAGEADPLYAGRLECAYADMARAAGLLMPETRLLPVTVNNRQEHYFAVRRFDRQGNHKLHCLSLAGYAYASHRIPCLDYLDGVLPAVKKLTKNTREIENAFRLMVFNILAHNKDDHSKNFAFLRQPESSLWQLAPAFDLTFNHGFNGHHTTAIAGEAKLPGRQHIQSVAQRHKISHWTTIVEEVRAAIANWPQHAQNYDAPKTQINAIKQAFATIDKRCAPG